MRFRVFESGNMMRYYCEIHLEEGVNSVHLKEGNNFRNEGWIVADSIVVSNCSFATPCKIEYILCTIDIQFGYCTALECELKW